MFTYAYIITQDILTKADTMLHITEGSCSTLLSTFSLWETTAPNIYPQIEVFYYRFLLKNSLKGLTGQLDPLESGTNRPSLGLSLL